MIKNISDLKRDDMFFLLAGPCVIEGEDMALRIAERVVKITDKLHIPYVFKGSYRKANRSRLDSFTGIGDEKAVKILAKVRSTFDVPVVTDIHTASEAEMAAEYVLDKFKDEKGPINVVEIQGIPGASATRDSGEGFHNIMDKNDKFNFISIQAADFDRQKGLQVMENIIQANPNIQVVFAHNDEMALGAVKAIKASGINALVIGFDGNDDAKDSIDANEMTATIAQQPDLIGALGVELTNKIYKGESIKDKIAADLKVYTK